MLGRLIYVSTSLCTAQEAKALCFRAQTANAQRHITGALYHSDGIFLQYLEGDEFTLSALYHWIRRDPRHKDCRLLNAQLIAVRAFKYWSMEWLIETAATNSSIQAVMDQNRSLATLDTKTATNLFQTLSEVTQAE